MIEMTKIAASEVPVALRSRYPQPQHEQRHYQRASAYSEPPAEQAGRCARHRQLERAAAEQERAY